MNTPTSKPTTKTKMLERINSGKFCTVKFRKKDGSIRIMKGRTGVKKYLKPGAKSSNIDAKGLGLVTFYELNNGYRSFYAKDLISVK